VENDIALAGLKTVEFQFTLVNLLLTSRNSSRKVQPKSQDELAHASGTMCNNLHDSCKNLTIMPCSN